MLDIIEGRFKTIHPSFFLEDKLERCVKIEINGSTWYRKQN